MTENKRIFGSDLAKVDAREIQPDEYDEVPEMSAEWFERAEVRNGDRVIRRGRPKSAAPKEHINIRLSARVVEYFKSTGPGWQSRIDAALLEWVEARRRRP